MSAPIPAGSVESQLRSALRAGATPEQATERVLRPYADALTEAGNASLAGYSRPSVLRDARRLARRLVRQAENRAFGSAPGSERRLDLGRIEFRLPDGTSASWAEATREQHERRVAWLATYIGSLEEDLERHVRAVKLLADRGAECLSEIEGWEDLIGDEVGDGDADDPGASGEPAP